MFIVDGHFDPEAVAALEQSFVDMGTLEQSSPTARCLRPNSCRSNHRGRRAIEQLQAFPITNPNVTRSRLVLEIASEMTGGRIADAVPRYVLPSVVLRDSRGGRPVTLSASSSAEGIFAVVAREVDLGDDESRFRAFRRVARQGHLQAPHAGAGDRRHSVMGRIRFFAVRPEIGLTRFEDIATRRPKLRILMRATPDHCLHHMFDDTAAAAGFSRDDMVEGLASS